MMKMHGLIDVLIPRGGAGLIANVVANSTVPVIETGTGNCHVYVDETADISMAADIIENGGSYIQKIIIVFLQTAICAVGTGYYLAKRDLFAREGEG